MNVLFIPVTLLMGRLRLSAKFLLIATVLILPTIYMLYMLDRTYRSQIGYSEQELAGESLAMAGFELLAATQQHRDLSSLQLAGKTELAAQRQQAASRMRTTMQNIDLALAADHLGVKANWPSLHTALIAQLAGWQQLKPEENLARHGVLIKQQLDWLYSVASLSGMALDPDSDTRNLQDLFFNIVLPASEHASAARGLGALIAARNTIEQPERSRLGALSSFLAQAAEQGVNRIERGIAKDDPGYPQLEKQGKKLAQQLGTTARFLNKNYVEAVLILTDPLDQLKLMDRTATELHDMGGLVLAEFRQRAEARIQQLTVLRFTVVGTALLLVLIGGYLFVGATLSIRNAVVKLKNDAQRLAAGALSTRVELGSRDELSQIASSFNHMAASLSKLVQQIRHTVSDVADTSLQLTSNAGEVSLASRKQAESTAAMATAVQQVTTSIAQANSQARHSAERVLATAREAGAGEVRMQATLLDIRQLAEQIGKLSAEVESMKQSSNQIGRIVQVINDIADQTNLLALNAAIEAARAGEAGRGFGVVADEVRKLAERTSTATEEIRSLVETISKDTERTAKGMTAARAGMEQSSGSVQIASNTLSSILAQSLASQEAAHEISMAMNQQQAASQQVADNVETIARMAKENTSHADANNKLAQSLQQQAEALSQQISTFQL
ncbi:methyl-accepting chemotaxis protein [Vogesella sp. GCM10023246]|uniref:Methyl-accepting chemotaxis protein n=1 Tax=Vogesella oryzagri TaxID=3160864 RepID=A0ABV1M2U9_9NEIS